MAPPVSIHPCCSYRARDRLQDHPRNPPRPAFAPCRQRTADARASREGGISTGPMRIDPDARLPTESAERPPPQAQAAVSRTHRAHRLRANRISSGSSVSKLISVLEAATPMPACVATSALLDRRLRTFEHTGRWRILTDPARLDHMVSTKEALRFDRTWLEDDHVGIPIGHDEATLEEKTLGRTAIPHFDVQG